MTNQDRNQIEKQLRKLIKKSNQHGTIFWVINDWFYGISYGITIVTPFALAAIIYFPNVKDKIGLVFLIVTALSTVLAVLRSVFRFGDRAKFIMKTKVEASSLLNKILLNTITVDQIVEEMKNIELRTLEEPDPY